MSSDKAERLEAVVASSDGDEFREGVQQFSENLVANAELVDEQLREIQSGNFAIM